MKHTFTHDGQLHEYDSRAMQVNIEHLSKVLRGNYYGGIKGRPWHKREQNKYVMHKAVVDMLNKYPPKDWHALVLEWPHVSASDPTKLAYTRSEEHGLADRQTVTSIGKYLTRHFIYTPSDIIRDLVAKHGSYIYKVVTTMREMLNIIYNGPTSCMSKFEPDDAHPYNVYDPELGWGMAARVRADGTIDGRALVWQDPASADDKIFVRTYARAEDANHYSQADDGLKAWLVEQGYSRAGSWAEIRVRRIPHPRDSDALLMPYLDGDDKFVCNAGGNSMVICSDVDGEYECDRTDGYAYVAAHTTCDCCGHRVDEEDMRWVGQDEDVHACDTCVSDYYVEAIGRRGYEAYIHRDNAIYVESRCAHYDEDYLGTNGIVQLEDGGYAHIDDCVHLYTRGEYVLSDSDDYIHCEGSGEYEHIDDCVELHDSTWALEDDAWRCAHDDAWYLCDDVTAVDVKNARGILIPVHPDHADEYAVETYTPSVWS